jgi:LmbE family N-acetylglucosaminyl deacetylase
MRDETVVFLHAHPDDEAIFTGLTMRRLVDAGARVVLVTATLGELGEPLVPLVAGETVAGRRCRELEAAAAELGVARVVLLGYRDSGMTGWVDNAHPGALVSAGVARPARQLAEVCVAERATTLVHYDGTGIYGHPDHVAVHRIGRWVAGRLGLASYQATVDREHLHLAHQDADGDHLVHLAGRHRNAPYGRVTAEIPLAVTGDAGVLAAKRRAIAVHASQVRPAELADAGFADVYGLEWFLRAGPPGALDRLGNAHAIA